jgi:hypothetical protein
MARALHIRRHRGAPAGAQPAPATVETRAEVEERTAQNAALAAIAEDAGGLGVELVDLAANVDSVATRVTGQAAAFEELSASADEILRSNRLVTETAVEVGGPLLGLDERVAFCAAVDVNGYLPTHNRKFSAPRGRTPSGMPPTAATAASSTTAPASPAAATRSRSCSRPTGATWAEPSS